MSIKKRLAFSAFVTIAFLLIVEAALAVFTELTPFRPFSLSSADPKSGIRTYKYLFNPDASAVVMPRPEGVYRIFCFGGSATRGTPFAGAGFPEFLQSILDRTSRSKVEVINLGADGFTSGMVAEVFRDALAFDPDLCIIYSGNNEILGFSRINRKGWPRLDRAVWWVMRHVRLVQLPLLPLNRYIQHGAAPHMFTKLPRVERIFDTRLYPPEKKNFVRELYIQNIDAMVKMAQARSVDVILCAPGSNLRDWIPMKSVHSPGLKKQEKLEIERAVEMAREALLQGRFVEARSILLRQKDRDPYYARLYTFLGRAELGLGNLESASNYLEKAVAHTDFFQQSPPDQNQMLLNYCRNQNLMVLDVDAFLRKNHSQGLPGFDMFADGCHPTLHTHYLIARRLCDMLYEHGLIEPQTGAPDFPDFETARSELEFSSVAEAMAYSNQAFVLAFLYPHPEYLDPAFAFLDKAQELGYPPVITIACQGYIRVLQGRMEDAARLFSSARNRDADKFAAAMRYFLGAFVRYNGVRLDIKPAGSDEKVSIYRATLSGQAPQSVKLKDCLYHLIWDADQMRFVSGSD
jgi:tetratricopeptide (TPR) repeat protein